MTTTDTTTQPAETTKPGLRRQVAPWAAMSALALAAGTARVAMTATDADAEIAIAIAVASFVLAVVLAVQARRRFADRHLRRRMVAACYLGATWMTSVTAAGFSAEALSVLGLVGSGLSLLWWRQYRLGPGTYAELTEPAEEDPYIARWAVNLGATGKALAGSTLTQPRRIKAGYRYTLNLVPGSQTVDAVRSMVKTLRGGLRLMPHQDIIVETHPDEPEPAALLTVVVRPPIRESQIWPGPQFALNADTGAVDLGPFSDGEGIARFAVYQRDGIFGGYLQGAPGSGKSRMFEIIALSCAASVSHPTIVWYGDGQRGDSSPMLVKHADYAATTPEGVYNMLLAAARVMIINGVENRKAEVNGFHPTPERPGLLVFIDEIHKLTSAAENPLLARPIQILMSVIAREGRKVGVGLVCADQSPTLDAFGGAGNEADTLRACLLAGNGVILRSETRNAKMVFNVDISPRAFPRLPGYAYLARPDIDARSAPFRGYCLDDDMYKTAPEQITWRSLPQRQANVAGPCYAQRHEVAAAQIAADAEFLTLADRGEINFSDLDALLGLEPQTPGTTTMPAVTATSDIHPPVHHVDRFWIPEPINSAGLAPGQQKVLDAIVDGHISPRAIRRATQYSDSQIYNLLGDLQRLGLIRQTGRGQYAAAA